METFDILLMEAEEIMMSIEPVDMIAYLSEAGDKESKKIDANEKKTLSALDKIKKAILTVANAIKNFCRSFVSKIREMFASKETKEEFAEWTELMKRFPELRNKKIVFLDFLKYKKMVEEASAKFDKVAKAHGTTEDEMKKAQEEFEEVMNEEPPTKEMELGDVFNLLKSQALDSLNDTGKQLMDRAAEMTVDAGKLGLDIGADVAKDPHEAIRNAGYASISHKAFAAAYQKEAKVATTWFGRGMKECRRNIADIKKLISTAGKTDDVSRLQHSAAKDNLTAMMLKSKGVGKAVALALDVRDADGKVAKGKDRERVAAGMEMKAGAKYSRAKGMKTVNRGIRAAKDGLDTVASLFGALKESVSVDSDDDE